MDENENESDDLFTVNEMIAIMLVGQDHVDQSNAHIKWRNARTNILRACGDKLNFDDLYDEDEIDGILMKTISIRPADKTHLTIFDDWS